ncbi:MAG: RNA polymerase sigma factor [Chloroflexota bacterium]
MGGLVPNGERLEVPFFALSRINQYTIEERRERGRAAVLVFGNRSAGIKPQPGPPPATSVAHSPDFAAASAFEDRYAQYLPRIYRYLYARCGNAEDAADLAQQVFLQALTARHPYREGSVPFAAWLFRIARNLAVDAQRRRRPQVAWELVPEALQPVASDNPETAILQQEAATRLHALLLRLALDKRELLALRFAGGLTCREIGLILGKSEDAIKKQLTRTLAALKEDYHADEG